MWSFDEDRTEISIPQTSTGKIQTWPFFW